MQPTLGKIVVLLMMAFLNREDLGGSEAVKALVITLDTAES